MEEPLRLIIKAANQKYEDLKIDCNNAWSVLDLKRFLNQEYAFKPEVQGQRLIYSGHLLKDTQLVREVVNSRDESPYVFHLVYWNATPEPSQTSSSSSTAPTTSPSGLRQRNTASTTPSSSSPSDTNNNTQSAPPSDTPAGDQRLDYYRAYNLMMSDYYRDMSQRYALAGLTGTTLQDEEAFFHSMVSRPVPGFILNTGPYTPGAGGQGPQVRIIIRRRNSDDQEGVREGGVQGLVGNVRALARNFERVFEGRDLVQDLFTFFKALFMSSMILVYSSSNRLLIVMAVGMLLYFHQFRRLAGPQNVPQNPQDNAQNQRNQEDVNLNNNNNENINNNNNNPQEAANVNNNNNAQNNIPAAAADSSPPASQGPEVVPDSDPIQQRQSRFRFIAEVVSSIFTSLIPEPPNVNQ